MGMFQLAILCTCTVGRHKSHMNKIFIHLWGAVPGEASETMVKLCLWPSICCKPPSYVPYNGTYVLYEGTFGAPDQGQMLDV
jgi:hypothetical protein